MSNGIALINGVNYSWLNNAIILFKKPVIGITKISLSSKQDKENNYGQGVDTISRGYGNKEYEGSISMYYDTWYQIIQSAPNFDPLDIPMFDLPVVIGGPRIPQPVKMVARCVEFTSHGYDSNQGDKKAIVELPLIIAKIDWVG